MLVLTACDNQGTRYTEQLEPRVRAFWDARVAGDLIESYKYEAVSVDKKVSLQLYARGGRIVYQKADFISLERIDDDNAVATLDVEYVVPGLPGAIEGQIKDSWILINGEWYHGPQQNNTTKSQAGG